MNVNALPDVATARPTVGVMLPRSISASDILPFAQRAEELGFDEVWVVEDLGYRGGIAQASAVLATTSRIRVGIGILPIAARNVGFAAMELNTLAEMFPGRLDAGLGHGMPFWMKQTGAWPKSPLSLLHEHTDALGAVLRGENVSTSSEYVFLDQVILESPAATPPPLFAGVRGPKSLAIAGKVFDGTILAEPATPEYIRAALDQVGSVPGHKLVAYNFASINTDAAVAQAAGRKMVGGFGSDTITPHVRPMPFYDELVKLREDCASDQEFESRMPLDWVTALTIAGTPEYAKTRVREMHDAGATSVVFIPIGADPMVDLEQFALAL